MTTLQLDNSRIQEEQDFLNSLKKENTTSFSPVPSISGHLGETKEREDVPSRTLDTLKGLNLVRLYYIKDDSSFQNHARFLCEEYIPERLDRFNIEYLVVRPDFLKSLGVPPTRSLTKDEVNSLNRRTGSSVSSKKVRLKSEDIALLIEALYPGMFKFKVASLKKWLSSKDGKRYEATLTSKKVLSIKGLK